MIAIPSDASPTSEHLRVAIAICSVGRPEQLRQTLLWLERQTHPPSSVVVVVNTPSDLPELADSLERLPLEVIFSPKGLTRQRNRALDVLSQRADIIFFMDDDYLPERSALEVIQSTFARMPEVGGVTGHLLADGINSGGICVERAKALIRQRENTAGHARVQISDRKRRGLYGCNMAFRVSAIGNERFDENLPLYGWQEDVDFSNRVDGKNIRTDSLIGVHCGTPLGRETNGSALGYSQIANPLYLMKKGTMERKHACLLMLRNVLANTARYLPKNSRVDRKARLAGNVRAVWDLGLGTLHPMQVLQARKGCL